MGVGEMLAMLMFAMVQAVPGPPSDEVTAVPRLTPERQCRASNDEIVVCGGGLQSQRLQPLPARAVDPMLPEASIHLGGGKTLTAHAENSGNPTISAPRAMVTLKIPF
jgi:hypothetical protein